MAASPALAPLEPRKEPVQARSRERFEKILSVALAAIAEKGVDGVAMSEIAAGAEISIASLYQYFPDKPSIVATLAHRFNEGGQHCVQKAFANVASPVDVKRALDEMLDEYYGFFQSEPGAVAVWQASQSEPRLQALDQADMAMHARTLADSLSDVWPDLAPTEARHLGQLFTVLIGMAVRSAILEPKDAARAQLDLCKSHFLHPAVDRLIETQGA